MKIIECVPNFSEGRNLEIINQISNSIKSVTGITLLDIDSGHDTNRTVMTFVGSPQDVINAVAQDLKAAGKALAGSRPENYSKNTVTLTKEWGCSDIKQAVSLISNFRPSTQMALILIQASMLK